MRTNKRLLLLLHALFIPLTISLIFATQYSCPIRKYIGIPCPSCGVSRALYAFAQGDIKQAFSYHPLFLFAPLFILFCIHLYTPILSKIPQKIRLWLLTLGIFILLGTYFIRLFFFEIV